MPFTFDNTEGLSQTEIDALNAELKARLADIPEDDTDLRTQVEKSFSDEVARR